MEVLLGLLVVEHVLGVLGCGADSCVVGGVAVGPEVGIRSDYWLADSVRNEVGIRGGGHWGQSLHSWLDHHWSHVRLVVVESVDDFWSAHDVALLMVDILMVDILVVDILVVSLVVGVVSATPWEDMVVKVDSVDPVSGREHGSFDDGSGLAESYSVPVDVGPEIFVPVESLFALVLDYFDDVPDQS